MLVARIKAEMPVEECKALLTELAVSALGHVASALPVREQLRCTRYATRPAAVAAHTHACTAALAA